MRIYASGRFARFVRIEIIKYTPALLIIFKNILRLFKTEIKIFLKEHSASAQKLDVLIKNECTSNGIFITE